MKVYFFTHSFLLAVCNCPERPQIFSCSYTLLLILIIFSIPWTLFLLILQEYKILSDNFSTFQENLLRPAVVTSLMSDSFTDCACIFDMHKRCKNCIVTFREAFKKCHISRGRFPEACLFISRFIFIGIDPLL